MANNAEQEKKKFPKRRKSKDNPYTIGYVAEGVIPSPKA